MTGGRRMDGWAAGSESISPDRQARKQKNRHEGQQLPAEMSAARSDVVDGRRASEDTRRNRHDGMKRRREAKLGVITSSSEKAIQSIVGNCQTPRINARRRSGSNLVAGSSLNSDT